MKFRFIRKTEHPVIGYQGTRVSYGDEVELSGDFVQKAMANPDYEAVQVKRSKKKAARKKVIRRG